MHVPILPLLANNGLDCNLQYVLTIQVRGTMRSWVDKNPTLMSDLIIIKSITNIWQPCWGIICC
jgi:hypothetical protein